MQGVLTADTLSFDFVPRSVCAPRRVLALRARGRHATASADPYDDAESAAPPLLPAQPTAACILRVAALLLGVGLLMRGALRLVMGAAR